MFIALSVLLASSAFFIQTMLLLEDYMDYSDATSFYGIYDWVDDGLLYLVLLLALYPKFKDVSIKILVFLLYLVVLVWMGLRVMFLGWPSKSLEIKKILLR
jgi:hypothetical protein